MVPMMSVSESPDEKIEWTPQNIVKQAHISIDVLQACFGRDKMRLPNDNDDYNCESILQKEWDFQVF